MTEHEDALRAWAKGLLPLEAATELLIRGGYAGEGRRWVLYDEERQRPWINFASIPELIGAMSGGQQRFLRIAASLGGDVPVILADELTGIDRDHVELVLAAVAHTAGAHEPGSTIRLDDAGTPTVVRTEALYEWPA
jgi:hypothetical protein